MAKEGHDGTARSAISASFNDSENEVIEIRARGHRKKLANRNRATKTSQEGTGQVRKDLAQSAVSDCKTQGEILAETIDSDQNCQYFPPIKQGRIEGKEAQLIPLGAVNTGARHRHFSEAADEVEERVAMGEEDSTSRAVRDYERAVDETIPDELPGGSPPDLFKEDEELDEEIER